jgi:adenylate cyclase class 2
MATGDQELEIKFYLTDMPGLQARLEALGARLLVPRGHELNLRFDTPAGDLSHSYQALRLRQDSAARLTYKGPGQIVGGVRARREIEFIVSDFDAARSLFEALGYQVYLIYEKYRATYELGGVLAVLDELPFGYFAELEGPDAESIRRAAARLSLDWEARSLDSYTTLFDNLRLALGLTFTDLTFENFKGLNISAQNLALRPAD